MIALNNVWKSMDQGATYVVQDVNLKIEEGETLVLLGSSGSGKTTTLRMINRLIEPTRGVITLGDRDIQDIDPIELRRSMGYVIQDVGLFDHLTVSENVSIVLRLMGKPAGQRRMRAAELLEMVGLKPDVYSRRYPAELSGGQQQRVGVARALAADPLYLLMDEPFGALDAVSRDTIQQELLRLKSALRKTIVFVTHDIFEALTLGDRIAVLHQGRVQQVGAPRDIIRKPATPFVKELLEKPSRQIETYCLKAGQDIPPWLQETLEPDPAPSGAAPAELSR
ncbi:MAG TPA: ATP-binding cassette domain-containing protein [Armatimonadota bacterium]|nr:ATP-binding cassette domain-containing protein [Armatimonadota bacterium]